MAKRGQKPDYLQSAVAIQAAETTTETNAETRRRHALAVAIRLVDFALGAPPDGFTKTDLQEARLELDKLLFWTDPHRKEKILTLLNEAAAHHKVERPAWLMELLDRKR